MLEESKRLEDQITFLNSQINSLPDGKFFCCKNGKYYKWYHSNGKTQTIIPKNNKTYAQELAKKKLLSLQLEEARQEKMAVDAYLVQHNAISKKSDALFYENEEYRRLLSNSFKPNDLQLLEWMKTPYDKNNKYPEQLIYKTLSEHHVRSKSEFIIDMLLSTNKIPFRYECALRLGEIVIYPDFTIRHPYTGKLYYWEHFGRMDDERYAKNAGAKLQLYLSHGFIPSIHLITTYETKEHPLTAERVSAVIKEYFQ